MSISKRAKNINPSPTLAITAKAKQMKKEGLDVVSFGAGEPDFDTPENIKEAAIRAIKEGFTKYTPASGMPELKEAIAKKFKADNGLDYAPAQIVISCGAKHSIFNIIQALCEAGDEVILPSPYWVSYPEQIKFADATPIIVETQEKNGFKISPQTLSAAITKKTKLLILNSPSNPTGCVYNQKELEALAEVIVKNKIYVISDEIYEKIIYDGEKHVSIASFGPEIKDLTIVVNGVSKSYSMTGWRIGYAAGPTKIISAINKIQSHSTSNPTSIAQKASLEALLGPQGSVKKMAVEFAKRRDYIVKRLQSIKGVTCFNPQGAFYVFPNVSGLFKGKIKNSTDLAEFLLDQAKVAVVPGAGFGTDNYIRLSYATSMENIEKGLNRIEEAIK